MNKFIPLSVPNLKGNELKYVTNAVEEEWVSTGGAYIDKFEKNIADYLKIDSAVACQSGTAALHLSLIESGVDSGDEVIVPTLTFIAAVNPVKYCRAYPIFMDCDDSLTLDWNKLQEFCVKECNFTNGILVNKKSKRKIKAIIVVHVFGNLANMDKIMEIAERYNLKVIEDATEALGSYYTDGMYKGKYAGTIGDFGAYSFNGNKIITTGGGGMVIAKDKNDLKKIKYLSTQAKDDALYYIHDEVGYNYRMTNLQAALGVAQLEKLEEFIEIKKDNYNLYKELLNQMDGVKLLDFKENIRSNYWFYSLVLEKHNINRDEMIRKLAEYKIQTRPIWGLIHDQKAYLEVQSYAIEKAYYYHDNVINIPCSSNLKKDEVIDVVQAIKNILSE
ncbi:UDP-N-acetylbacillosamine transaminase [Clostridium puniceum]|uniref:UDP-N-acetylbacillosamine transaminase n=1 Tax=Clostridium puniceum TaxID=29367 RepID=A0A1S8TJG3_9CLOT|nr:LegC family aminotransferase [Clostridium puniceum]OOM77933.1 UDP-N-acetylbacillosamine transaminase [Clostridium puniceum]